MRHRDPAICSAGAIRWQQNELPLFSRSRYVRCSCGGNGQEEEAVMKLTRTIGAAIGLGAVLLFFASLTLQQGRVTTVISNVTAAAHK